MNRGAVNIRQKGSQSADVAAVSVRCQGSSYCSCFNPVAHSPPSRSGLDQIWQPCFRIGPELSKDGVIPVPHLPGWKLDPGSYFLDAGTRLSRRVPDPLTLYLFRAQSLLKNQLSQYPRHSAAMHQVAGIYRRRAG